MKGVLFFYIVYLSLLSCKNPEKKEVNFTNNSIGSLAENATNELQQETYLVNDSLARVWEKKLLGFTKTSNFKSEKTAVENLHDDSIIDTIINYSKNNSKIEVYKAQNFEAVKSAYIESPDFLLDEFLHVGSKKMALETAVKQGLPEGLIKVGNEEGTSVFIFTFEDIRIHSITFEGYVD